MGSASSTTVGVTTNAQCSPIYSSPPLLPIHSSVCFPLPFASSPHLTHLNPHRFFFFFYKRGFFYSFFCNFFFFCVLLWKIVFRPDCPHGRQCASVARHRNKGVAVVPLVFESNSNLAPCVLVSVLVSVSSDGGLDR